MRALTIEDVYADLAGDLQEVSRILAETAASHLEFIPRALDRPLASGGKRLRPALVLLSARAVSESPPPEVVEIAAAAEAIHLATLILDDVIDQAELRRGQETLHRVWGNEIPVLLAEYVFARTCARLATGDFRRSLAVLANVSTRMCEGELMEVLNRHNLGTSEAHYLSIIEAKTAALFSACCQAGGLAAEGPRETCEALEEAGREFGVAYQIVDDVLDFLGEERLLGKRPGQDLVCGRVTLPLVHALGNADPARRAHMEAVLRAGGDVHEQLPEAVTFIKEHGGFDYARQVALGHAERAKEIVRSLPESHAREGLLALTDYALEGRG